MKQQTVVVLLDSNCRSTPSLIWVQHTWHSHTEQDAVVDNGDEAQDTFGPLQLLGFQARILLAGRRHIGPVDHDLGASPG